MRQGKHLGRYPNRPGKQTLMEDKDGVKLQDSKFILEVKPRSSANLKWTMRERTESKVTLKFGA